MIKTAIQMLLTGILLLVFTAPGFAEVNIVPNKASVEQGLQLLTIDVEGAEQFRFTGRKDGLYQYQGKITPGSKLKFVFKASLHDEKALPLTGRSCIVDIQVIASKGGEKRKKVEIIETKAFSKENKSNLFLNYTVPQDADTLEVNETFELYNESKNEKFNKKVTSRNQMIFTTRDTTTGNLAELVQKAGVKIVDDSDGKANVVSAQKDDSKPKSGKIDAKSIDIESKESNTGLIAGVAVLLLAAGAGAFFFMKKKKASKSAPEVTEWEERQFGQEALQQNSAANNFGEPMKTVASPVEDEPYLFCSNCGAMLEPGSAFCGECGQPLATMNLDPVQQRYQTVPIASAEVPPQTVFIPQVQTSTVAMAGRELDCGEMNKAVFGTVQKAAVDVLSPVNAFEQGISSFVNGVLLVFKKPKALLGTVVLAVLWFVLGWLGDSDSPVLKALSWLTFSEGGFDRSVSGAVCGALGKGTVATALASLFTGGMKNTFKGVGALFSGHGEKRNVVSLIIGAVVGLVMYFVFAGPDASGKTAMAGIAGMLLSLQALGGGSGRIYELAQSLTAGKLNGARTALAGKCDGLLTGLALGFALATVLSVIR